VKSELPNAKLIVNETDAARAIAQPDDARGVEIWCWLDDDSYQSSWIALPDSSHLRTASATCRAAFSQRMDEYPEMLTQPNFGQNI
jgi:hypothetical protein